MLHAKPKKCKVCGSAIVGRRDKQFCTDSCRSIHHQEMKKKDPLIIKTVNSILKKNRSILLSLNPEGKKTLSKDTLSSKGFDYKYSTHHFNTKRGTTYFFCYDQGYTLFDDKMVLLVTQKNEK
ncbi:MAG: DUF2116 family Zn-ribbon domain-containing protein [Saprospiraceae bacterium]|nr:DUF2116 family Zn-ribbon domain-containing protein [Saprospiraceae bacterium]